MAFFLRAPRLATIGLALAVLLVHGCSGDDGDTKTSAGTESAGESTGGTSTSASITSGETAGMGRCGHDTAPSAVLGRSIGDDFTPYAPGEEVELLVAPQGGYGVPVSVRTEGLLAGAAPDGSTYWADVELFIERDGMVQGQFYDGGPIGCLGPDVGGLLSGLVAGFDPGIVSTNEDLLALDGAQVTVRVSVTDTEGVVAEGEQLLTVRVGG
ncbi:MAG: hypothetical protein D6705_08020 [Deltaproteobacteria bacterium]|nr:MAG: hypothetical protein D6705_08020 [Deltaproteobacteria bacterium]